MKLLFLWIAENENKTIVNQGFNLGGRYHFDYQSEKNTLLIKEKKNYIEDFYNMSMDKKYGVKDITAIVGANGSGKTTLLNLIKDHFSTREIQEFKQGILNSGFLLVTEDEDTKVVTVFCKKNKNDNATIVIECTLNHSVYYNTLPEIDRAKLNILIKKYDVREGYLKNYRSTIIEELDKVQLIYFSNVVDYFTGGNIVVNKMIRLFDISSNALIKNDIEDINIFSKVNQADSISKRTQIGQLDVFKKYENVRKLNFLTSDIKFEVPFKMPTDIIINMFDIRKFKSLGKEYDENNKGFLDAHTKILNIGNENNTKEHYFKAVSVLFFIIQELINVLPFIKTKDEELLSDMSIDSNLNYWYLPQTRKDYSVEDEVGMLKKINEGISSKFLSRCNSKQANLATVLKQEISLILEIYNENEKNYNNEMIEVEDNQKKYNDSNIYKFHSVLDEIWDKVSNFVYNMKLSEHIKTHISNYLYQIPTLVLENHDQGIKDFIDIFTSLVKENYNNYYLKDVGTFNSVYNPKFFRGEGFKLNRLMDFIFSSNVKVNGELVFNLMNDKDKIQQFIKIYKKSNIIFRLCHDINYPNLSSGEKAFLNLCSRLYSIKNEIKRENILVLIDEIDLYFHPQWQKELIYNISNLLSNIFKKRKIQLIISSHSPFVLSDLQKCNVIFLDKDTNESCIVSKGVEEEKETFASNIHTLFTDSFFVKDGLIGKLAKEKIREVIDLLTTSKDFKDEEEREYIKKIIHSIGEPLIKNKLINMYNQKANIEVVEDVETLKRKMKSLEERLSELEKKDK